MISRGDYSILIHLYQNDCTTEIKAFTLLRIKELTGFSLIKLRKSISMFKKMGFISEGAVIHRTKTYYITKSGIKKVQELGGIS